nr:ATP-binding protein [Kineosphaera limosa]
MLSVSPVVVIEGARQVGKSTLATLLSSPSATYVTMDDDDIRLLAQDDPVGFLRSGGGHRLVIDEIQRCPELVLPLKAEVDRDRRPGRFVLTGSANLLRVPGAEDSLAGRAMTIRLHPFSQGELTRVVDDWVAAVVSDALGTAPALSREDLVTRIVVGGYPTVQGLKPRVQVAWLTDYAERLVERDSADIAVVQPRILRRLLALLAAAPGQELILDRLAEALAVAAQTVSRHLDILESLFLVQILPSWSRSLTSRQVRRPKCYLTDTGLAAAWSGLTVQQLMSVHGANHLGPLLENFVVNELTKQAGWSSEKFDMFHFRDRNGAEVDLVIETSRGVIAVEVKAAAAPTRSHFKHLIGMRERLGDDFLAGVVLHLGAGRRAGDRLWSLPINALWTESHGGPSAARPLDEPAGARRSTD